MMEFMKNLGVGALVLLVFAGIPLGTVYVLFRFTGAWASAWLVVAVIVMVIVAAFGAWIREPK